MTTSGPGEFAVVVVADVVIDLYGGVVRLDVAGSAANDAAGWEPVPQFNYYASDGFYDGNPMVDLRSYEAVGRVPDGNDTGDNALDFTAGIPPTPGEPNPRLSDN